MIQSGSKIDRGFLLDFSNSKWGFSMAILPGGGGRFVTDLLCLIKRPFCENRIKKKKGLSPEFFQIFVKKFDISKNILGTPSFFQIFIQNFRIFNKLKIPKNIFQYPQNFFKLLAKRIRYLPNVFGFKIYKLRLGWGWRGLKYAHTIMDFLSFYLISEGNSRPMNTLKFDPEKCQLAPNYAFKRIIFIIPCFSRVKLQNKGVFNPSLGGRGGGTFSNH